MESSPCWLPSKHECGLFAASWEHWPIYSVQSLLPTSALLSHSLVMVTNISNRQLDGSTISSLNSKNQLNDYKMGVWVHAERTSKTSLRYDSMAKAFQAFRSVPWPFVQIMTSISWVRVQECTWIRAQLGHVT